TTVEPIIFHYQPDNWRMYIKTDGQNASQAVAAAQKVWQEYEGDFPFSYTFLDEDFDKMYKSDERTGSLFMIFAMVAILISCLGLLGLATFTAQIRTKEIGIRKVLGATVTNIVSM